MLQNTKLHQNELPAFRVNGREGAENPRVPLRLTAATLTWYQKAGVRSVRTNLVRRRRLRARQDPNNWGCRVSPKWRRSCRTYRTWPLLAEGRAQRTTLLRGRRASLTVTLTGTVGSPGHGCKRILQWLKYMQLSNPICCLSN